MLDALHAEGGLTPVCFVRAYTGADCPWTALRARMVEREKYDEDEVAA